MIILDSSFLLAVFRKIDSLHKKAVKLVSLLENKDILYLEDVLKEVQTVLALRHSHSDSFVWIESVYENETKGDRQYNLNPMEYFEVLNEWKGHEKSKMSFVDAEIIYLAKKYEFPVLTFDEEIQKRLPKTLIFIE